MQKIAKKPEIRFAAFTDNWKQSKFSDVVNTRRGLTYSPNDVTNSGVRVLRSSNIDEDTFVLKTDDVFVKKEAVNISYVDENDILITASNGSAKLIGKHTLISGVPKESAVHGGFMLLATSRKPSFINALMGSAWYKKFIDLYVTGCNGAIGNLNKKDLDDQCILIPSDAEQKKIGDFFSDLDHLIDFHQRKYIQLLNIKKSMLKKMFPQNGFTVPAVRFAGFKDDWKLCKLNEFVEFYNGLTYKPSDIRETGTLVLRSSNVFDGKIVNADNVYVTEEAVDCSNVSEGDIIMVVRNGSRSLIGKHAQIKQSMPNTVIGAFMTGIKADVPSFINALFSTTKFDSEVAMNMGATINQITGYMFSKMEFLIPSKDEQEIIGAFFNNLDDLIIFNQCKLEKLKNIKRSCLEKMFVS